MNFVFQPINAPPTLDPIASPAPILEDAGQQSLTLTGISAGAGENQPFTVTAVSSDTKLVPNPVVEPQQPADADLRYASAISAGTAVITVTVMDAGLDGDFDTARWQRCRLSSRSR